MDQYLPLYRPGDTVTFSVTSDVVAGVPVQVGAVDMSVEPAEDGTESYVGIPGHDAAAGDNVTVEIGKPIHELTAVGSVARGDRLAVVEGGVAAVDPEAGDLPAFLALASAADGAPVAAIQL